ncbi:MAG TPA: O-methyltransferase [Archangium sp.]|uniref:O-methyltransferase n=1 Tax=Archangium sp. TaxID=1872627 RepID=UPI002E357933|nr:O-methyltransferase [Archangium sp.]HEX5751044.1 O-methyltransferase [Archangium sp.]
MSAGSSLPYRLRPNKAVDRELFLSLLTRLAPKLGLETYHYVGLGGPFLEDFRLVHARLGIAKMTCIETEEQVHKRQVFNRPIVSIECIHKTLEDYLDETDFKTPAIIWFDYTEPKGITTQIERFARTIGTVPIGSVLRVTLNANPMSLGKPDPKDLSVEVEGEASEDRAVKPTIQEWRLSRFKERLGALFPSGLTADGMSFKKYGPSLLRALKLAVDNEALSFRDRRIVWALATHYADGQAMVTAALVVAPKDDTGIEELVKSWEFYTTTDAPHRLDLPALSTLERLTMESNGNAEAVMGFELPKSDMGENPFEVFKKFYRIYPHFSRVEL